MLFFTIFKWINTYSSVIGLTPRDLLKSSKFLISELILITARQREYQQAAPVNFIKSAICLENYVLNNL